MKNTKEKITINMYKEFIIYISRNKKSWKIIDELYYKYYDACVNIEEDVKKVVKMHGINLKSETIESTCHINRLIALMLLDEYSQSVDNVVMILKTAFNKAYKYAVSNTIIKISSYSKRKVDLYDSVDNIFSEYLALLMTALIYGKKIDEEDEFYISMLEAFYGLDNISNGSLKTNFSYMNCSKERKSIIDKLELNIRGKFYESGYNVEGLHDFLEVKGCFGDIGDRRLHASKIKDDVYSKIYCAIEYANGILNKVNTEVLFKDIDIKKETVKDFINAYLIVNGYDYFKDEGSNIDIKEINLEELSLYVAVSLVQALYIESYEDTYRFFFENFDDAINVKYKNLLNEDREVKKTNLKLQDENEKLKIEVEELQRKLDKSNKEIEESKVNNKELFELRNYIFNNQEDIEDLEEENIDLDYLKDKKIVCFGGNKAWISNMSKEFDNWTFIPADAINFDTSILKDVDIVYIKATYISHSMYYKVIANMDSDTEIKFINNSNINRVKNELHMQNKR